MVSSCWICSIRYRKTGKQLKFHRFPKDESRRKKWLLSIARKDSVPSNTTVICSNHFREEDYYVNPFGTNVLKSEAIPSIFNFSPYAKQRLRKTSKRNAAGDIPPTSRTKKGSKRQVKKVPASLLPTEVLEKSNSVGDNPSNSLASQEPSKVSRKPNPNEQKDIPSTSHMSQEDDFSALSRVTPDRLEIVHEPNSDEEVIFPISQATPKPVEVIIEFVSSKDSTPRPIVNGKRKRSVPVHAGDFSESDLECPWKRKRYWDISQASLEKHRKNNKYLLCKVGRYKKKIDKLESLIVDLKKMNMISFKKPTPVEKLLYEIIV